MGRFLFVASPLIGHTLPALPVGRELMERGHDVALTGHAAEIGEHLPPWAPFIPLADGIPHEVLEKVQAKVGKPGGLAGFLAVWQDFVAPVARQMIDGVHRAIEAFKPDVVITDQQAIAGAVAAESRGLPWATSATTSVELIAWLGEKFSHLAEEYLDQGSITYLLKLKDWHQNFLRNLVVDLGLDPVRAATFDPRFSPKLVVAFTTPELMGYQADVFPEHFVLVGPSIGERPASDTPFDWKWLDADKPLVLVTLGTINWRGGSRFFKVAADAISTMDVQAVVIAPGGVDFEPPPNVQVYERVPQLSLLRHVDAVVSHGGQGTVCETLAVGKPLVIAPIRDDQPMVAGQVTRAGAGLTVKYSRITVDQMRASLDTVLTDPSYRASAERVKSSFEAAGGPREAATRIEQLQRAVAHAG